MKTIVSFSYLAVCLLAIIVSCPFFGQASVGTAAPPPSGENLIIDFNKVDLDNREVQILGVELREGPGSGGGGNSCALMLKLNTIEILEQIQNYPPFQAEGVIDKLESKIKAAQFQMGFDLHNKGKKVEAINYRDTNVIEIEQAFCDRIAEVTPVAVGTLLHEYLGLTEIDDTGYQVSSDFVRFLYKRLRLEKNSVAAFSGMKINNLREEFRSSQSLVNTDMRLMDYNTRCTFIGEENGKATNHLINFLLLSNESATIQFVDIKTGRAYSEEAVLLKLGTPTRLGTVIEIPTGSSYRSTYMVLRKTAKGQLIAEWSVLGKTPSENKRIAKTAYPVRGIAMPGTFVTGYSVCAKGRFGN